MQENKYYTPDIEDIRVGYVCESSNEGKEWYRWEFEEHNFGTLSLELLNNLYRTPYLTDQQIVNEGWEPKEVFGDYVCIYQKGTKEKGFELVYNFEKHNIMFRRLYFYGLDEEYTNTKLSHDSLECKSINELRVLEKLFKTK